MSLFDELDEKQRTEFVSVRFTPKELADLQGIAAERGISRSDLIRAAVLASFVNGHAPAVGPELIEIVGVRILLLTLMKPLLSGRQLMPEAVDQISVTARQMKKELAAAIAAGEQD